MPKTIHGETGSPEWWAWRNMISRCTNKNAPYYKNYGGRGIKVYGPWRRSFMAFLRYVGRRPSSGHSLERVNNNGDYEPGNVKWATKSEQGFNRRPRSPEHCKHLREARIALPPSADKNKKLSIEDVRQIKRKLAAGPRGIGTRLAKEYGVHVMTISDIRRGATWSHV